MVNNKLGQLNELALKRICFITSVFEIRPYNGQIRLHNLENAKVNSRHQNPSTIMMDE